MSKGSYVRRPGLHLSFKRMPIENTLVHLYMLTETPSVRDFPLDGLPQLVLVHDED